MGFFDKLSQIATGDPEKNKEEKEKAHKFFNTKVPNGDEYTLVGCYSEDSKLNVGRTIMRGGRASHTITVSNFLIGYKENPKEIVICQVDYELTEITDPIVLTPENAKAKVSMTGAIAFESSLIEGGVLGVLVHSSRLDGTSEYKQAAVYMEEAEPFTKFLKSFNK